MTMGSIQNGNASDSASLLNVQPGMIYTCQSSAVCCQTFETITVDPTAREALTSPELQKQVGSKTLVSGDPKGGPHLARTPCGDCVMLTRDHLCAIHSILGAHSKPQVCQDFPFRYTETPGGTFVGLSFVCPSVRGKRGDLLSDQIPYIKEHHSRAVSHRETDPAVHLDEHLQLEWAGYLAFESQLIEILSMHSKPLSHRIAALGVLVNLLPRFVLELHPEFLSKGGQQIPLQTLEVIGATLQRENYESLFRIVKKPIKGAQRSRRMFLGMFAVFSNRLQQSSGKASVVAGVMGRYLLHAIGLGGVRLKPFPVAVTHAELSKAVIPDAGPAAELITRYLAHSLFRKDLLLGPSVARRLRLILINAALIPWYAAAHAKSGGRQELTTEDFSEAISHVEKYYGFHSQFYDFFQQNAWFDDVVEGFILKPNFPMIMMQ